MPKWIAFVDAGASPSGKTRRWEVKTKAGVLIGRISWDAHWRKYVLTPSYPTDWEEDCLRDVAAFLEEQTRAQKAVAHA